MTSGIREFERFAVSTGESVRQRVESEITGGDKSSEDVRGCDEGMGGGVDIVTSGEITVIRGNDRIDLALLDVPPIPSSNARTTIINEDQAAGTLQNLDLSITGK